MNRASHFSVAEFPIRAPGLTPDLSYRPRNQHAAAALANSEPSPNQDGLAEELSARLERAIYDHEYAAATLPSERLLAAPALMDQLRREDRVRVYLDLMTWAIKTGVVRLSFALQRKAVAELGALAAGSEVQVRGQLRLLLLHAERARHGCDAPAHLDAVRRASSHLLQHRHRLSAEERYLVVWEIVRLLAVNGQREAASRLARRMADFAAAELGAPERVESAIFANSVLLDASGAITAALRLSLPRIGESGDSLRKSERIQPRVAELRTLAQQAASVGVPRWAAGWIYRARCSLTTLEWVLGGGRPDPMIEAMHSGLREMRRTGNFCRQREREIALQLSMLAADHAGNDLREARGQPAFEGIEGDYLVAAQHALADRNAEALAAYARYAVAAHRRVMVGQLAVSADLLAVGEVLLALPKRLASAPAGQDAIRVVCRSVRLGMEHGPSAALSAVAMEQGLTARRVQQAFKSVGLESPGRFLRRLENPKT